MSLSYRHPVMQLFYRVILWPLEACLLFLVLGFISILSIRASSFLFGRFFALIGPLTPWQVRAQRQLEKAMPELQTAEQEKILRRMWENLGRNLGEYPKLEQMLKKGYIQFEGHEHLRAHKGGFVVGAHLANWEALAMVGPYLGLNTGLVYRPLNNPYISFLLKRRGRTAQADIYEKGREAAMGMIATIRKGGYMLILADQQLREGIEVDFFAMPARTAIAHFKIAAKTHQPVFFAQTCRKENSQITVKISEPVFIPENASDADIQKAAKQMNETFEQWIRAHPDQWLWPHRRWGK